MKTRNVTCPTCGKRLAATAPMGLCPECLLNTGFESSGASGSLIPAPLEPSAVERRFPALQVMELIGRGGMGAVYKARQMHLERTVALKILHPSSRTDAGFTARFQREARVLAQLQHPGIVTLYEFGVNDGLCYLLMEYVDGVNLRHLLAARHLPPKEALSIVMQICDALEYAHERGIVHRDIKPENILIGKRGEVKIADFGVARIVGGNEAPTLAGTPRYMAPEQIAHPAAADHRVDIYALGVIFYQMLTGQMPSEKLEAPSRKMFLDTRLDELVLRALQSKPEQRYQQVGVLKTRIEALVEELQRAPRPKRRLLAKLAVAAVVAVGIAVGSMHLLDAPKGIHETSPSTDLTNKDGLTVDLGGKDADPGDPPTQETDEKRKPSEAGAGTQTSVPAKEKALALSDAEALEAALKQLQGSAKLGTVQVNELLAGGLSTNTYESGSPYAQTVESVYVTAAPVNVIRKHFPTWDPTGALTKVYRHQNLSHPDERSFISLGYEKTGPLMRQLASVTEKLPQSATDHGLLNLSEGELKTFEAGIADGTATPSHIRTFWMDVLVRRANAFDEDQARNASLFTPPTRTPSHILPGGESFHLLTEVKTVLPKKKPNDPFSEDLWSSWSQRYWEFVDSSNDPYQLAGALVLGARFVSERTSTDFLTIDFQYYVSGGYYGALSIQILVPVKLSGKPATLVWQKDTTFVPLHLRPQPKRSWKEPYPVEELSKARINAFRAAMQSAAQPH